MSLEPADIAQVMDYLDLHTCEPDHAELAFIPGTRLRDPVDIAIPLYQNGIIPYIVVTGGVNRRTGLVEAHAHRDLLLQAGVPQDRIIVEDTSTNTLDNVQFALPKIAAVLDLSAIRSIVVIAKWFHARRVLMTLKRHLPSEIRYFPYTYEPEGITRTAWPQSAEGLQRVLGNWEAISKYLARDHLAEVYFDRVAYV